MPDIRPQKNFEYDGEELRSRILSRYKSLTEASFDLRIPNVTLTRIVNHKRAPTRSQYIILKQAGLIA